jgi:hypothetical protein
MHSPKKLPLSHQKPTEIQTHLCHREQHIRSRHVIAMAPVLHRHVASRNSINRRPFSVAHGRPSEPPHASPAALPWNQAGRVGRGDAVTRVVGWRFYDVFAAATTRTAWRASPKGRCSVGHAAASGRCGVGRCRAREKLDKEGEHGTLRQCVVCRGRRFVGDLDPLE